MKLLRAEICNFRLLKDLALDFSNSDDKKLTVIRAANETGKTTCKTALLWGLFGNRALPNDGKRFPLFPSDLRDSEERVEVSVEIEFETEQVVTIGKSAQELQKRKYRLKRSCFEYKVEEENPIRREGENIVLFEIKPEGTERVLESQVSGIIESSIPIALKDVYFTDGDSAMSFIEAAATTGVKRKRVSAAVEALLGLEVLKSAASHLSKTANKFSSMIDDGDYKSELERLNDQISGWEEDVEEWESERLDLEEKIRNGVTELGSINKKIEEVLKLGDSAQLAAEINQCVKNISQSKSGSERALNDLSSLLNSESLSAAVISPLATSGLEFLNQLSEKKQLPKVNVPILEELLDSKNCFCGADLSEETEEGENARAAIASAIEESRKADKIQEAATSLFYAVRSDSFNSDQAEAWLSDYASRSQDYSEYTSRLSTEQKKLIKLKSDRDAIDDSKLNELRELENSLESKLAAARIRQGQLENSISDAQGRKGDAEKRRQELEKKLTKTDTSSDKLRLTRLAQSIFNSICDRLMKEELLKVSDQMNRIFLEMIGSDPEANDRALITRAELTEDFDILVYGSNDHKLDPDQDLNGASRRAITLAFILALTKVSQVEAPNVIDTPLGMMAGYVKRSVLTRTIEESSQVILFLTQAEISGVEDIIDTFAGKVFTLTNPAHYPRMLVNEPAVKDARVVRCECNHRSHCSVCERIHGEISKGEAA